MNTSSIRIREVLRQHKYITSAELLSIHSLRDLPFGDQDVCRRIRFPRAAKLDTIYFLKENKEAVLAAYIRDKWTRIRSNVLGGVFLGDGFSPLFLKVLQEHVDHEITFLEADIGSMEDDISDAQDKIDMYENVSLSLNERRKE